MAQNKDSFILEDKNKIEDFVDSISHEMAEYIKKSPFRFVLFYKYLTHSDLATFGKATKPNHHFDNFLYYINEKEMAEIEANTKKPFQTAHQSCIGLKKEFYEKIGLPDPREVSPYLINDYMDVLLVNSSLKYFNSTYTQLVFQKLNKKVDGRKLLSWDFNNLNLNLSNNSEFTEIKLHVAVHGLGMEEDSEFHKLRHFMFKGDTFMLLCELNPSKKKLFILLEKNPVFFSLIGVSNEAYEKYQKRTRERIVSQLTGKQNAVENVNEVVTRQQQSAWRQMLAKEMMGYTQVNDQVFCPFTYITADFSTLGALFVASHIKGFADENTTDEEKYDINNGLLLCANADALFDKHLITISENKELVFSFLLANDVVLKQKLLLMQPIFQPILNEKRMKYLEYHRKVFEALEIERKTK